MRSDHLPTMSVHSSALRSAAAGRRAPALPPLLAGHQQSSALWDMRACMSACTPSLQPASLLIYKLILPQADL